MLKIEHCNGEETKARFYNEGGKDYFLFILLIFLLFHPRSETGLHAQLIFRKSILPVDLFCFS